VDLNFGIAAEPWENHTCFYSHDPATIDISFRRSQRVERFMFQRGLIYQILMRSSVGGPGKGWKVSMASLPLPVPVICWADQVESLRVRGVRVVLEVAVEDKVGGLVDVVFS
jgi:hypothetical protein